MGLSPWQLKRQLAWWIAQQVWEETPQGLVISGGALVSEDAPGNFRRGDREVDGPVAVGFAVDGTVQPFALVSAELVSWDGESLARLDQVVLVARFVAGGGFGGTATAVGADPGGKGNTTAAGYDTHGVNQVTGALRAATNGQGQSQGRDVDELLGRIAELVGETGFVDSVHGFQGRLLEAGPMEPVFGVQVLERGLALEVLNGTPSNQYGTVLRPKATKSGSDAVLTWLPGAIPNRYDATLIMVRRGRNAGDPAPTTPAATDGNFVAALMPNAVGYTQINPGAGAWNYSIFTLYSETPGGWPTVTVLGLALSGYTVTVRTTGGDVVIPVVAGADLASTATAIAAAINASAAAPYARATAAGAVVTLQPIGSPPWLGVTIEPGATGNQLDRNNGDRYARVTASVVI